MAQLRERGLTLKAILFDLDDTLVSEAQTFDLAMAACFRDLAVELNFGSDGQARARRQVRQIARKQWLAVPEAATFRIWAFTSLHRCSVIFPVRLRN